MAKAKPVRGKKGTNPVGMADNFIKFGVDKPPLTHEQAVENGRKGGKARAIKINKTAEMDEAFIRAMNMPLKGDLKENLKKIGYDDEALTNSNAMFATAVAMALKGDLKALELLMNYYKSMQEEDRKREESKARIKSLSAGTDISVSSTDDDDGGVVIYLPKIEEDDEEDEETGGDA